MSARGPTPEELRKEIDATRRELGDTVEQLAAKTAVRTRLHARVERVRGDLKRPALAVAMMGVAIVVVVGLSLSRRTD